MKVADLYKYDWPSDDFQVKLRVWNKNGEKYEKSFHGWIKNGKVEFNASRKNMEANYRKVDIIKVI